MSSLYGRLIIGGLFALATGLAATLALAQSEGPRDEVIKLNQGWSDEDRLQYYNTSQGGAILPYDIFLNLEAADSANLFRSDEVVESLGMIPQSSDPKYNPDGLPLGIDHMTVADGRWKGEWTGMTCAACHTADLHYKGKRIRIDGSVGTGFEVKAFFDGLDDALAAAVASPDKFDRLAARLNAKDDVAKAELRTRLQTTAADVHEYARRSLLGQFPAGPGRVDALTQVHNRIITGMAIPQNWLASLAPTKIPFLWNAPQSSWVQWTGVLNSPLKRNGNESLAFVKLDLFSKAPEDGLFDSTMDLDGLMKIEHLLRRLAPPKWPEDVLGPIDRQKAAAGAGLFKENCAECHSVWPHRWSDAKLEGKRFIENALVPLDVVGTDAMQFRFPSFDSTPSHIAGAVAPYLAPPLTGAVLAPWSALNRFAYRKTIEKALKKFGFTAEQVEDAEGYRSPNEAEPVQPVYKAGPRDGVWATGPFLHNGSVPNLYELLAPAAGRSKTFYVGRDFDPIKVGVDTSGDSGKAQFDTTLLGNSNAGHSFEDGPRVKGVIGRRLTDEERWDLIEYLKSIPTEDAQITLFGGPKDPVEAWKDPTFFNVKHSAVYGGK